MYVKELHFERPSETGDRPSGPFAKGAAAPSAGAGAALESKQGEDGEPTPPLEHGPTKSRPPSLSSAAATAASAGKDPRGQEADRLPCSSPSSSEGGIDAFDRSSEAHRYRSTTPTASDPRGNALHPTDPTIDMSFGIPQLAGSSTAAAGAAAGAVAGAHAGRGRANKEESRSKASGKHHGAVQPPSLPGAAPAPWDSVRGGSSMGGGSGASVGRGLLGPKSEPGLQTGSSGSLGYAGDGGLLGSALRGEASLTASANASAAHDGANHSPLPNEDDCGDDADVSSDAPEHGSIASDASSTASAPEYLQRFTRHRHRLLDPEWLARHSSGGSATDAEPAPAFMWRRAISADHLEAARLSLQRQRQRQHQRALAESESGEGGRQHG